MDSETFGEGNCNAKSDRLCRRSERHNRISLFTLEGRFDRLPVLAEDLVGRKPTVIMASGPSWVHALKARTATIPVVFAMGEDPVKEGLVASLNRPGENITGVSSFQNLLLPKRLQLLHEIVPRPAVLAFLVNPNNPNAEPDSQDARTAATTLGRQLVVLTTSSERGLEEAFATLAQRRVGGLIVGADGPSWTGVIRFSRWLPGTQSLRFTTAASFRRRAGRENFRQCGIYVGRILSGEKPTCRWCNRPRPSSSSISGSPRCSAYPSQPECSRSRTR